MQTVLINIFNFAVLKNILTPGFVRVIDAAQDVRFVVVISEGKHEELSRALHGSRIEIVARKQRFASTVENAAMFIARNSIPTHSVRQLQEDGFDGSGRLPLFRYLAARCTWLLGHLYWYRAFLKRLLPIVLDTTPFDEILERYKPDLVFATTIYAVDDLRLLRATKRHGITTLGMIKSWDNLSSKDFMLIPPDALIVHNELVKQEAMRMHHYPSARISVVGVPQFDWHVKPPAESRDDFCKRLGLDPKKRIVTYSAMGRWYVHRERETIEMLSDIVAHEPLPHEAQLLVRMHPAYPDTLPELKLLAPSAIFEQPGAAKGTGTGIWKQDWKFSDADEEHLTAVLRFSDVIVNCGSTMILDAACLDTPTIGIAFDGGHEGESYWRSARRFFKREHCLPIVASGGIQIAHDRRELVEQLQRYLADKKQDHEGRARMVLEQTGVVGGAGERLARAMLAALPR